MPVKPGCKGMTKTSCGFGKGLARMVDGLIDVKNKGAVKYRKKYRR